MIRLEKRICHLCRQKTNLEWLFLLIYGRILEKAYLSIFLQENSIQIDFFFYLFAIQCKCICSSALKNRKLTKIHICARKRQTIKYHHDSWGQNTFKVLNRLKQWLPISISWRRSTMWFILIFDPIKKNKGYLNH